MPQTYAPLPPKEIAADDFSRAPWRDGSPGGNRELFNSQSGRYEPVPARGGSMRPEPQHGRQPALLQRPLQYEQQGPMDHPGAFQGGRNNEQQGQYGRRRGSSNVSGGSGSWQRLKGLEHPLPPPELINARRASMTGASDGPTSPGNFSPSTAPSGPHHGQAWQPRASPGTVHATPYQPGAPAPDGRGMPPPVQLSPSVTAAVPVTEDDYELQKRLMRERRELAMRRRQEEEAREEAARRERIRLKLEALGPAPESNKAKKAATKEQTAAPTQIQSRESISSDSAAPAEPQTGQKDVSPTAIPEAAQQPAAQTLPQPDGADSQPHGPSPAHPWTPSSRQADRQPPVWGPQPSTKNVWAAPNNNRTLGNGTFAVDIGATQLPSGPGPIAPPSSARAAGSSQVSMAPVTTRLPPIGPPRQTQVSRGTGEREMKDSPWAAAVRLNDDKFSEMLNAQYDERDRRLQAEGRSLTEIQPAIKDTWRPTTLDDNGVRTEAAPKQTLQIGEENPWAESKPVGSQSAPAVASGAPSEYSQLPQGAVPARDMASASILGTKTAAAQGRGSRFFPSRDVRQETRDVRLETSAEALRHQSPSPPPPDMAGHPAFDGDATHPHVSLPRPHPVVRLPPSVAKESQMSTPEGTRAPVSQSRSPGPSFAWATQAAYKESDHAPRGPANKTDNAWQAKIDNLLGGRKVHSSRAATTDIRLSHPYPEHSYPGPSSPRFDMDGVVTTKVMAEECFEEQEMGSVPPIRLPKTVPEMAWQPSPMPKPLSKKLWPAVLSADAISFPVDVSGAGTVWRVCMPGKESKSITIPFGRTRSNPRRGGSRGGGGRHASSSQRGQGKGREASSYSAEQGGSGSGSNPSQGRNHRGGYRARDNWSRNASSQIQT